MHHLKMYVKSVGAGRAPSPLLSPLHISISPHNTGPVFIAVGLIMDFHSIQSASIFLISVI